MKNKVIILITIIFILFSCHTRPRISDELKTESRVNKITFAAVGDNLFHDSLIRSSLLEDGTYDFSPIYTEIKDIIKGADLTFINQETIMGGTRFGYTGYPAFNTPQALAGTLADTGFHIINLANNHAMDKGRDALYSTLDFLNTFEQFTVIGARKEGPSARIITKNNITLGFLSYTFSLNGIPLPRENPNLVSMIDRDKMTEEITALRPLCDFLIVSMHWGAEYLLEPDKFQTDTALFLAEQNVDLIIGHHPHVLQRVETLKRPDGRETLCFYSLGNFASHQRERERIIGGMMVLTFKKEKMLAGKSELTITDIGMLPIITHYDRNFRNTKLYPLYAYTEELLNSHRLLNEGAGLSYEFFNAVTGRLKTQIITQNPFFK